MKEQLKEKGKKLAGKGKGFLGEFKEFILRGNVIDMAIGVIIGTAFSGLITAFTQDFINPLINGIGGVNVAGIHGQFAVFFHCLTGCFGKFQAVRPDCDDRCDKNKNQRCAYNKARLAQSSDHSYSSPV